MVNELLIQLQSFEQTPASMRIRGWLIDMRQRLAAGPPAAAQADGRAGQHLGHRGHQPGRRPRPGPAAAGALRPQHLLRPPQPLGRRDIIDYYLGKKAHEAELDDPATGETLAALTAGYSPVMIEHLMDESLVWALRRGATGSRGTTSSRPR